MTAIRNRLINDVDTMATILPIKVIRLNEISTEPRISSSWKILYEKYKIGSQYDFLARYAQQHGITLELGLEKAVRGKATSCINKESKMIPFQDHTGDNFKISETDSTDELWNVFRYFTFPLWDKNKLDEVKLMQKLNCGDIVDMTWFCHAPLFGKPCGHCNPCKDARAYGFSWRLSLSRTILWYFIRPRLAIKSILKNYLH